MGKTCCFVGHSEMRKDISKALAISVERHITEFGVTDFFTGNYGQFDRMAAATVKKAKVQYPGIRLYLMLPYRPELGRPLPDMEGFDSAIYPAEMDGIPHRLAIPRLNRIMVKDSDYVIAYVDHSWGGAAATLEYAYVRERKGELQIENLAVKA